MKKVIKNEFIKKFKKSLLNFSFIMIYEIRKISVFIKNHLNYLKDSFFECFFEEYNKVLIY